MHLATTLRRPGCHDVDIEPDSSPSDRNTPRLFVRFQRLEALNRQFLAAETSSVRKFAMALGLCASLLGGACSASDATSNVGTLDAPAVRACDEVRTVIQARAAGAIAPEDLRARLALAYSEAQASTNPIIRTRAVALFADATEIASGGEGHSIASDLMAMDRTCSGSA